MSQQGGSWMLLLKQVEKPDGRSTVTLYLDGKIPHQSGLDGVINESFFVKRFARVEDSENTFLSENVDVITVLGFLSAIKTNGWNIYTTNFFLRPNTGDVEKSFYFERSSFSPTLHNPDNHHRIITQPLASPLSEVDNAVFENPTPSAATRRASQYLSNLRKKSFNEDPNMISPSNNHGNGSTTSSASHPLAMTAAASNGSNSQQSSHQPTIPGPLARAVYTIPSEGSSSSSNAVPRQPVPNPLDNHNNVHVEDAPKKSTPSASDAAAFRRSSVSEKIASLSNKSAQLSSTTSQVTGVSSATVNGDNSKPSATSYVFNRRFSDNKGKEGIEVVTLAAEAAAVTSPTAPAAAGMPPHHRHVPPPPPASAALYPGVPHAPPPPPPPPSHPSHPPSTNNTSAVNQDVGDLTAVVSRAKISANRKPPSTRKFSISEESDEEVTNEHVNNQRPSITISAPPSVAAMQSSASPPFRRPSLSQQSPGSTVSPAHQVARAPPPPIVPPPPPPSLRSGPGSNSEPSPAASFVSPLAAYRAATASASASTVTPTGASGTQPRGSVPLMKSPLSTDSGPLQPQSQSQSQQSMQQRQQVAQMQEIQQRQEAMRQQEAQRQLHEANRQQELQRQLQEAQRLELQHQQELRNQEAQRQDRQRQLELEKQEALRAEQQRHQEESQKAQEAQRHAEMRKQEELRRQQEFEKQQETHRQEEIRKNEEIKKQQEAALLRQQQLKDQQLQLERDQQQQQQQQQQQKSHHELEQRHSLQHSESDSGVHTRPNSAPHGATSTAAAGTGGNSILSRFSMRSVSVNNSNNVSPNGEVQQKNSESFRKLKEEEDEKRRKKQAEEEQMDPQLLKKLKEDEQAAQQHDSSKTAHYARLGSTFAVQKGGILGGGGGRTGGRGGISGRGIPAARPRDPSSTN